MFNIVLTAQKIRHKILLGSICCGFLYFHGIRFKSNDIYGKSPGAIEHIFECIPQ